MKIITAMWSMGMILPNGSHPMCMIYRPELSLTGIPKQRSSDPCRQYIGPRNKATDIANSRPLGGVYPQCFVSRIGIL